MVCGWSEDELLPIPNAYENVVRSDNDLIKIATKKATVGFLRKQYYEDCGGSVKRLTEKYSVSSSRLKEILQSNGIQLVNPRVAQSKSQTGKRAKTEVREYHGYVIQTVKRADGKYRSVKLHRLVMERLLGRELKRGEMVHHINLDKSNNEPENLFLCQSEEHGQAHASLVGVSRTLIQAGVIIFYEGSYMIDYNKLPDDVAVSCKYPSTYKRS
jgi:hypothetical protein